MKDAAKEEWFYNRKGERIGPVNLAELKIKASEGELHPRIDMVWMQGMPEWKPAGEIDGLFERNASAAPESSSAKSETYMPPTDQDTAVNMALESEWPGARRRSFYLMTMIFPFVWSFGFAAGSAFLSEQFGPSIFGVMTMAAAVLPVIVILYFGLQRLANVGMSRWWYLANFVPLLNLWVSYRMYVCPAGYAYHKKLDGIGIFLAILYWLMIIASLAIVVGFIAVFLGMAGNPEIQKQLNDAIQEAMRHKPTGL